MYRREINVNVKAVPVQAYIGPDGPRKFTLPRLSESVHKNG
jgi:hypothetical protein